jgi:hypothetical protein
LKKDRQGYSCIDPGILLKPRRVYRQEEPRIPSYQIEQSIPACHSIDLFEHPGGQLALDISGCLASNGNAGKKADGNRKRGPGAKMI